VAPDDDALREEVVRLRDWRHSVVTPGLSAAIARAVKLAEDLEVVGRRLDDVEQRLNRMARADEIAEAVAAKMSATRRSLFTTGEKVGAFTVGALGVASLISQWLH
jgi:hypothetical protein